MNNRYTELVIAPLISNGKLKTPLIAGNSDRLKTKTISSQSVILYNGRFNDYSERKYTQASGNGRHPI